MTPSAGVTVTTQSDAIIKKLEAMGPVMQPLADGVRTFEYEKRPTAADYQNAIFLSNGYSVPSPVNINGLGDYICMTFTLL